MCAVPLVGLQKDDLSLQQLQTLQKLIKKRIPTGEQHYSATATVCMSGLLLPPMPRLPVHCLDMRTLPCAWVVTSVNRSCSL